MTATQLTPKRKSSHSNRSKRIKHGKQSNRKAYQPLKTTQLHESLKLSPEEELIFNRQQSFIEDILKTNERLESENKKLHLDREQHIQTIKKLRNLLYGDLNRGKKTHKHPKTHGVSPYTKHAPRGYKTDHSHDEV